MDNPAYRVCFVLDKASMFRSGPRQKYIKPLHIIWSKYPNLWGKHNTVHVDDLHRNFAMNPENGILVRARCVYEYIWQAVGYVYTCRRRVIMR